MKRIVFGLIVTVAMGSAIAQSPQAPKPAALVRANAGVVQVEGGAAITLESSAGANIGDTVTIGEGSKATLTYADGCVVSVVGSVQIAAVSPCKAGLAPGTRLGATSNRKLVAAGLGALALVGVVVGSGGDDKPSSP